MNVKVLSNIGEFPEFLVSKITETGTCKVVKFWSKKDIKKGVRLDLNFWNTNEKHTGICIVTKVLKCEDYPGVFANPKDNIKSLWTCEMLPVEIASDVFPDESEHSNSNQNENEDF